MVTQGQVEPAGPNSARASQGVYQTPGQERAESVQGNLSPVSTRPLVIWLARTHDKSHINMIFFYLPFPTVHVPRQSSVARQLGSLQRP